jgi:probable addiction module antidote protein
MNTHRFDVSEHLHNEEDIADYLNAAMDEGGTHLVQAALGNVAKARRRISQTSQDTGISRGGLYKALGENGNPSYENIVNIAKSLGMDLKFVPSHH